jgi:D-alanine-D-alanine ligase
MVKMNKRIEIVRSSAPGLSSLSQVSAESIFEVLTKHYTYVRITIVNNLADLEKLAIRQPDLVFLGVKFVHDELPSGSGRPIRVWVTKFLDKHAIAYTGSGQKAHKLELDKALAKQCVHDAGLNTSPFLVMKRSQQQVDAANMPDFPLFIKPVDRGGGAGIDSSSVVHNYDQLHSKVRAIAEELDSDSLIERYLPGREFSVAILKDEFSEGLSAMPIELIAPVDEHGARILTMEVKSSDTESFVGITDKMLFSKISTLALNVFRVIGGQDYGRIDVRLDENGLPHFLEANLIPSLIRDYGNFPKACLLNQNLDYESMILNIVNLALARSLTRSEMVPEMIPAITTLLPAGEPAFGTVYPEASLAD